MFPYYDEDLNCLLFFTILASMFATIGICSDFTISKYSTNEDGNKVCQSLFAWAISILH